MKPKQQQLDEKLTDGLSPCFLGLVAQCWIAFATVA